ncbi:MAG: DEAD/DEAH box helicase [Candidatus Methylacidiphilales bacterium]|nr:DEAD/DEAH box helicase [Candidatus Methylacidiphilales bacterium]
MDKKPFSELGLSPETLKAVEKMGFEEASPIQTLTIPVLLSGSDVVGQSQTGSGKTAAFALPAIECVDPAIRAPQVLILCPTRELAVQVAEEVAKLAIFKKDIRELPIYGGQSYDRQFRGLEQGAQIIIGTPGRVMDHLERKSLKLDQIRMVILDEADRMLDMGFVDDIRTVLSKAPPQRQTVFFSATLPRPIQELIKTFTRNPQTLRIESQALTIPSIDQVYYEVDRRAKVDVLCRLIDLHDIKFGIIFCATKMMVDELTEHLLARGYGADKMHGDMTQAMRERTMNRFRKRSIEFLVATDVAARGLDVDDIEVVFNYDLPNDGEDYIHRIGRTGRAGRHGKAITFVAGREIHKLQFIIRTTKSRIKRERIPTAEEVEQKRRDVFFDNIRETLEKGTYTRHDDLVDRLLEQGHAPTDIASALIDLLAGGQPAPAPEPVAVERPLRHGKERPDKPVRAERTATHDRERPQRREERPEPRPAPAETREVHAVSHEAGMVRVVLNVGRDHRVMPGDIVGVICGASRIPKQAVGAIFLKTKRSYVDIAESEVKQVLKKLNGIEFKGRKLSCDISRDESAI